jgi:oxygen-dependent protoporphyrinogen oxidase
VRRRFGREALERVAQPLVAGIYTADPDTLSLRATMPRFPELERRYRSVILGLWRAAGRDPTPPGTSGARWSLFVSFAAGMEELPRALAGRLPPESIRLKERVTEVRREGRRWHVLAGADRLAEADRVIIAVESYQAARMLRYVDPALVHLLEGIPYASSATVTFAFRRPDIRHSLDGFGFVVPRIERRPIIACTFSSVKYPGRAPDGGALLRVFLGGALDEAILEGDDESLAGAALEHIRPVLGVTAPPLFARVVRYLSAMPQYLVGHRARVDAVEASLARQPGLALAGGAYRGVGIADCVRSGEEAAERLLSPLESAPACGAG